MKRILLLLIIGFFVLDVSAQPRRSGKVRRKFRNTEVIREDLPTVFVHGRVRNLEREPVIGATVVVRGTRTHVNTNENGDYFMTGLTTGINSIMVSHAGYKTKIIDYYLQEGNNDVYFTLDRGHIVFEPLTSTSQKREQQILEIPSALSIMSSEAAEIFNIRRLDQLAELVPGMYAMTQTPHRPVYSIRGITSDEAGAAAHPRVSVYLNQVPMSRASMSVHEIYDMDRIEIMKGPQGTLFGRGAMAGAVQYVTRKPSAVAGGYLTAGTGEFGVRELQGALNLPVVREKLMLRASGIYNYRDGYVENTFGGSLNGNNSNGGRISLRAVPFERMTIDLMVNYQKDDSPGTAYMSRSVPNSNGVQDIFTYQASLDQGEKLFNRREVLTSSFDMKIFRNENSYWSSSSSYTTHTAGSLWDGDGTQAPAIGLEEALDVTQFTQEIRYNFSAGSRTNGFWGMGYWRENAVQNNLITSNDQYLAYMFLQIPESMIAPNGNTLPMTTLPDDPALLGTLAGMALPEYHEEAYHFSALNQAFDLFGDATWKLRPRLSLTVGVRGTYEIFSVTHAASLTGGSPSVLGAFNGTQPNLLFRPASPKEVRESFLSYTGRINIRHDFNSYSNAYVGYGRGRKPGLMQFNPAGQYEVLNPEILHTFHTGFKWSAMQRFWLDAEGFYQLYRHFQSSSGDSLTVIYQTKDAGQATSYGIEVSARAALFSQLSLYGNYAWIRARFDTQDSEGDIQEYAGHTFRLTPEHSFHVGLIGTVRVHPNLNAFFVPSYAWKSHFWFQDSNIMGLEQSAYGLLNVETGFKYKKPALTLALTGSNILNEKFLIDAGNTSTIFGSPVFVPGSPRMLGIRLTWNF